MTPAEYNNCVKGLSDNLYRFAWKSLADKEYARDAVQMAFAALWEQRREVPEEKARSFLFTITYRKCMDLHRSKRKTVDTSYVEEIIPTENRPGSDLKKTLERALNRLDEQSKNLVLLKDYEGYSYDEIGKITGLSETQVKVYLHRARKALRNYLVSREYVI
jgi:RNA polymerase sigma factor (sigma-70 family)